MSQNRQEEKDRERAGNDYKVNLKTEIIIEDLYGKLSEILSTQRKIQRVLKELTTEEKTKTRDYKSFPGRIKTYAKP